jgi:lysophospholipase L1-like esterase
LDATANVPGTFVYNPPLGTVLSAGTYSLSTIFTPTNAADYTTASASVTLIVNQAVPVVSWSPPAAITYGTALSASLLNATASVPGAFSYSPALGAVLSAGSRTLSVTFTPTDPLDYATVNTSVTLTVNQVTPQVTWANPAGIVYGTSLNATQLNATASVPGSFAYTPAQGMVLTAGTHALSATFTPTDSTNYSTVNSSVQITVSQATPQISWANPAAIVYGTALSATQLNTTASVPGTFAYSPDVGAVLSAGSQTLSVVFTPTDTMDYTSASASVTLTVNKATPQINWAAAFPIAVGAALGTGQLDAIATAPGGGAVAGSFLYSPPTGTVFKSPGPQTLNSVFTPADTLDYTTAQASLNLNASSFGVVTWGDSLTWGDVTWVGRGDYPAALSKLLILPVENMGVRGQTSTQIGVREGGVLTYATVENGMIPASGGVTVTFPKGYEPVTVDGPAAGVTGSIMGVRGTVTIDSTATVYTFTPSTALAGPVSAPGAPQFVVDTPYANYLPVFWEGRDNYEYPSQVISDLAAQVATIPAGQNYLVMSVILVNRQNEWIGGISYDIIAKLNSQLAAIYGSHYFDIEKALVDSYNPALITDVSDYNHDMVPTSLRAFDPTKMTLGNAIGPSDTTFTINSPIPLTNASDLSILTIDTGDNAENVSLVSVNWNSITVDRNYGGNNTSHGAGVPVQLSDYTHLDRQGEQVVANAVAQYLSTYELSNQ